jgi:hypothetical protein
VRQRLMRARPQPRHRTRRRPLRRHQPYLLHLPRRTTRP